jgi:hypothetical protein
MEKLLILHALFLLVYGALLPLSYSLVVSLELDKIFLGEKTWMRKPRLGRLVWNSENIARTQGFVLFLWLFFSYYNFIPNQKGIKKKKVYKMLYWQICLLLVNFNLVNFPNLFLYLQKGYNKNLSHQVLLRINGLIPSI